MRAFMSDDFLLTNEVGRTLYFAYADKLPIIDYHCHLSPEEIATDKRYSNITEVWLYGDHYKWRAMRSCGVDEREITGDASDYEKFRAYCRIMPKLIGNPLYHWSHLELRRYFDCKLILNEENCDAIWRITSEKLQEPGMSVRGLMESSHVVLACTTDDPADSLEWHKKIKESDFSVQVLPTFRPDKAMNIERRGIKAYLEKLGQANDVVITDLATLEQALKAALDRFSAVGCRLADHGNDNVVRFAAPDPYHADLILKKAIETDGQGVSFDELALFQTQMMRFLGKEYVRRGMAMQLHAGVLRNPNSRAFTSLGSDSGFDTVYGENYIPALAMLLDYLEHEDALPRTVLYSVNPVDNAAIATLCGSFCKGDGTGYPRVTQGCAWWFNDNIDGMRAQMRTFANMSAFGNFLGMLTDSRSFLSYPRHEYFRRIFCNLLGEWVESGQYPADYEALAQLVVDVCFNNAKDYFGFKL